MNSFERILFFVVRFSAVLLPLITGVGIYLGGPAALAGFLIVFGFYFLVDFVLWASGLGAHFTREDEFSFHDPLERVNVQIYAVLHLVMMPVALVVLATRPMDAWWFASVLSVVATFGTVGGLAGHEFIHRRAGPTQWLGILVFASMNYSHFKVSHLLGHHRSVGVADDWSTAHRYESYYAFLYRAIVHGYLGAWRLEAERLRRSKRRFLSSDNFMLRSTALQLALLLLVGVGLGLQALLAFVLISFAAVSLMEVVNYLSHYGLERGKTESIGNHHSWESAHKVTNWFIFNAGKHCHHHTQPHAQHHELELAHEKDYLPYGLPAMALIAFVPPAYFALMDRLSTDGISAPTAPTEAVGGWLVESCA